MMMDFILPSLPNATRRQCVASNNGGNQQFLMRQMRTEMAAVVPIGKQTVIGAIDDASSTKRYEVAVTATRLK
jgi:hypothetical protein